MFYFLIKILFFIVFIINFSLAEIVNKIEINGNKRISNETILVLSNIKQGKDLNEDTLNESLKKIRGNSSVDRAQPCQGWGRGFEPRFSLING